ncbi:MAG: CotH kinase family protein [Paludibacteraceae bacterium]|nr:CotH kinase family protein [Paludibacteraceae bacterium]
MRINEILQSNVYHLDENMYLPDSWIELYNDSDEDIDLNGWTIAEGKKNIHSYSLNDGQFMPMGELPWRKIQSTVIPAKGYALIYCDEEGVGMHASFKLDNEKNHSLWLYNANGVLVDSLVKIPALLYPDVSYGRVEGNDTLFSHFASSSPMRENDNVKSEKVAPEVEFSQHGGIFFNPIFVELSVEADSLNDYIYYTLDGSEPTQSSLTYSSPIRIDKTTVLRTRVLKNGLLPRNTQTQSFMFPDHEISLPILSLAIDSRYLNDDFVGIYSGRKCAGYAQWDSMGNYVGNRYRYASIEYYNSRNKKGNDFNQPVLLRIGGGATRTYEQKSFVVKTNKYLPKKSFESALWESKPHITETKSFVLRNGGNDNSRTMFREAMMQHLMGGKEDLDFVAYQPCVVYVNGEYWGLYNIRERSDKHWVSDNTGLSDDEFNSADTYISPDNGTAYDMVKIHDDIEYGLMNHRKLMSKIDSVEVMNYMITELFSGNIDWPQYNVMVWQNKGSGIWRFLCKDIDLAVGLTPDLKADVRMLDYIFNKPMPTKFFQNWQRENWHEYYTRLMRYLLSDDEFVKPFLERSVVCLGTYFRKSNVEAVVDSFSGKIESEMEYHRKRWRGDDWKESVEHLRKQLGIRADYCYQHLSDFYDLGPAVSTKIYGEDGSQPQLYGLDIPDNKFEGRLFVGMPAKLKCAPDYYWRVHYKGWDGESYSFSLSDSAELSVSPSYLDLTLTTVKDGLQDFEELPECEWWFNEGFLHLKAHSEPIDFVEVLSVDGKCLYRGEKVNYMEIPLPKLQICLLRYQTASRVSTFKVLQN